MVTRKSPPRPYLLSVGVGESAVVNGARSPSTNLLARQYEGEIAALERPIQKPRRVCMLNRPLETQEGSLRPEQ